jgi:hypothetical protein
MAGRPDEIADDPTNWAIDEIQAERKRQGLAPWKNG